MPVIPATPPTSPATFLDIVNAAGGQDVPNLSLSVPAGANKLFKPIVEAIVTAGAGNAVPNLLINGRIGSGLIARYIDSWRVYDLLGNQLAILDWQDFNVGGSTRASVFACQDQGTYLLRTEIRIFNPTAGALIFQQQFGVDRAIAAPSKVRISSVSVLWHDG